MLVEGSPSFHLGEEIVLFLEPSPDGTYSVTSWAQGTFRIARSRVGEAIVTQDSSHMVVYDRSARRLVPGGVRSLPFDQFRRRLAAAIARSVPGGRGK